MEIPERYHNLSTVAAVISLRDESVGYLQQPQSFTSTTRVECSMAEALRAGRVCCWSCLCEPSESICVLPVLQCSNSCPAENCSSSTAARAVTVLLFPSPGESFMLTWNCCVKVGFNRNAETSLLSIWSCFGFPGSRGWTNDLFPSKCNRNLKRYFLFKSVIAFPASFSLALPSKLSCLLAQASIAWSANSKHVCQASKKKKSPVMLLWWNKIFWTKLWGVNVPQHEKCLTRSPL